METLFDYIKSLWGAPGLILAMTIVCVIWASKSSYDNDEAQKKIKKGVGKIDTIVTNSEQTLNNASKDLLDNTNLVLDNLERTKIANEQLMQASEQLQENYKQIVQGLKESIKAKEEAINAKNEAIKSKDEIIGKLMGGESYPGLTLKKGGFYLTAIGKYNIPNLKIAIILIRDCLEIPQEVTLNYLSKNDLNGSYFKLLYHSELDLRAGVPYPINIENFKNNLPVDDRKTHAFEIVFETKLKKWIQRIRITSFKGKWEIANILDEVHGSSEGNTFGGEKEILKQVSEDYPALFENNYKKYILFFNSSLMHPKTGTPVPMEYNDQNGISDCSFDDL